MPPKLFHWLLFLLLSLIWGSSFMLMKEGMNALSPGQVAALRMITAGIVLLPFAFRGLRKIPRRKIPVVILSGLLGNFFPAFLFCFSETQIDTSLAGILNALTPLFTVLVGVAFFSLKAGRNKITGVTIGFAGLCLLFTSHGRIDTSHLSYGALILLATLLYGINVNLVSRYLQGIASLDIAAVAFGVLVIPSLAILYASGYFSLPLGASAVLRSTLAGSVLGIMGTAVASILFYMLMKRAGAVFASMVTYGIPFVAVVWGIWLGETIGIIQVISMGIILCGVAVANRSEGHRRNL